MSTPITLEEHQKWMGLALNSAQMARASNEVPIGAVLVHAGKPIAQAFNQTISQNDPTAHAELLCLRQGAAFIGNHRLTDCSLYVTLEPCLMCLGAMIQARVKFLIYGVDDSRIGCISQHRIHKTPGLNHHLQTLSGICSGECALLLRDFFKARR
jgi:tRNA(Arg) A34 adenosine deaminase TadA